MNNQDTRFANQYNIQWFPGHMTKTLRMMEQEIQHVDASLVLLDARIPLSSLNPEIERITARKPKLYVLNKADLLEEAGLRSPFQAGALQAVAQESEALLRQLEAKLDQP